MSDPNETETKKMILMIPKFIFTIIIMVVLAFFIYMLTFNRINTDEVEMKVFVNRLLYSENALTFHDKEIDRSYIGVIDLEKLNSENLDKTLNYTNDYYFAANITLIGEKSATYHQELYEDLKPLADAKIKGAGGADKEIFDYTVSYYKNNSIKKGSLRIEVLRARS